MDLDSHGWYYGQLSRNKAEEILLQHKHNGAFLIRGSESTVGAYALSLRWMGVIFHYRILTDSATNMLYIEGANTSLPNLASLVDYYTLHHDGLECCLIYYPAKDGSPIPLNSSDGPEKRVSTTTTSDMLAPQRRMMRAVREIDGDSAMLRAAMTDYVMQLAPEDGEAVATGTNGPVHLQTLLNSLSNDFQRELVRFVRRAEIIEGVIRRGSESPSDVNDGVSKDRPRNFDVIADDFESLVSRVRYCRNLLTNIDLKAMEIFKQKSWIEDNSTSIFTEEAIERTVSNISTTSTNVLSADRTYSPYEYAFDVKKMKGNMAKIAMSLRVDVLLGVLNIYKKAGMYSKIFDKQDKFYQHNDILQLIKSRGDKTRLGILFSGKERKDYIFASATRREHFCQVVQMMKNNQLNRTIGKPDVDISTSNLARIQNLKVWVGSWNMGEADSVGDLSNWFAARGLGSSADSTGSVYDIYAIGVQECTLKERELIAVVRQHLGADYEVLSSISLRQIRLFIFVRNEHINLISHVHSSTEATGIANALGNKGAVATCFHYNSTSFCFVNCHLASGAENMVRRNQNFIDIVKNLNTGEKWAPSDITCTFQHLFWFGDLNYRINLPTDETLKLIHNQQYERLWAADQLRLSQCNNLAFGGFLEGPLNFPPTYRYDIGNRDTYVWKKEYKKGGIRINVPSYTDRILWRSFPNTHLVQTALGCVNSVVVSDHSPVFSTFDVGIFSQYIGSSSCEALIVFDWVSVELDNSTSKGEKKDGDSGNRNCGEGGLNRTTSEFYLEFFAPFLENKPRTRTNRQYTNGGGKSRSSSIGNYPLWGRSDFPELRPFITERLYLEQQHLLVGIRVETSGDFFGFACISLKYLFSDKLINFSVVINCMGREIGSLVGRMHVIGGGESIEGIAIEEDGMDT